VDEAAVHARHRSEALRGIGVFKRTARQAAKAEAAASAQREIDTQRAEAERQAREFQDELDRFWSRLCANDPDAVLATLSTAFEDNEAAAAPVGVAESEAAIVVLVPGAEAVPERRPTTTSAGNLTLKKLTKAEAAAMYFEMVCGYVLVTAKEALAVSPGLATVRLVALRQGPVDAFGNRAPEVMLGVQLDKSTLARVRWSDADASQVVEDAGNELVINRKGRTPVLQPVDLTAEPGLRDVVTAVDLSDLTN
jgi:hypothetical protein